MEPKTWKVLAIVFMSLFILESLFLGWAMIDGQKQVDMEFKCGTICENQDASYYIDTAVEEICYCIKDGENVHIQYLG